MTKLPRLYVKNSFSKIIYPISLTITQNIVPLSTASITLRRGDELPSRSYVELFTPYGSAGMFRVRSPHNVYGDDYSTAELEHMVAEVGDYVVKGEYSQMMAANTAVKTVFGHYKGSHWQLGSYSAIGTGSIALEAKYESVLNILLSIMEQVPDCMMTFDFSVTPWRLNIVKQGTSVVAEGRLSRNVRSATVTYDDSELVTRVWYQTFSKDKEGKSVSTWVSKDADTLKTYGVVESSVSTSVDMTTAEINATVNNYLKAHKNPKTSVSIQASELNRITGERVDKFLIGDLMRLAIPDYNITVELNITSIMWSDVYNKPDSVMVHLGDEEDTVVTFLHNLDATGSGTTGGSGGGGGKKKQEYEWGEYKSDFQVLDDQIYGYVQKVNKQGAILEQAGLDINSKGVLIYSQDNANNILSKINVQADRISLVVEGTGPNAKVKRASIVAAINKGKSTVKIQADEVELSGFVKMDRFSSLDGTVTRLITGQTRASKLWASTMQGSSISGQAVYADNFYLDRHSVTAGTITVDGTRYNVLRWS